jgi:hypothetical protein
VSFTYSVARAADRALKTRNVAARAVAETVRLIACDVAIERPRDAKAFMFCLEMIDVMKNLCRAAPIDSS